MKIQPWQEKILNDIMQGRELKLMMAGRNVGKSMFSSRAFQRLWEDIYNRPVEDLVLSEGRLSGARYFCVEPVGGNWADMESWCKSTFGEPGEIWPNNDFNWPDNMRWSMNNRKFWFREEKDRTMFILKWR